MVLNIKKNNFFLNFPEKEKKMKKLNVPNVVQIKLCKGKIVDCFINDKIYIATKSEIFVWHFTEVPVSWNYTKLNSKVHKDIPKIIGMDPSKNAMICKDGVYDFEKKTMWLSRLCYKPKSGIKSCCFSPEFMCYGTIDSKVYIIRKNQIFTTRPFIGQNERPIYSMGCDDKLLFIGSKKTYAVYDLVCQTYPKQLRGFNGVTNFCGKVKFLSFDQKRVFFSDKKKTYTLYVKKKKVSVLNCKRLTICLSLGNHWLLCITSKEPKIVYFYNMLLNKISHKIKCDGVNKKAFMNNNNVFLFQK